MLDAVIRKKLRGHLKDLMHKDADAHRLLHEDVITSTVFGSLQHMSVDAAWWVVKNLLLRAGDAAQASAFQPCRQLLRFWPSLNLRGRLRVEPDLIFEFRDADGRCRVILLEIKWNADLMDGQLEEQKRAVNASYPLDAIIHQVLLVKTITAKAQQQVSATGSNMVTWHQLAGANHYGNEATTKLWISQMKAFISRLGILPFHRVDIDIVVDDQEKMSAMMWKLVNQMVFDLGAIKSGEQASFGKIKQWRISI